jgi:hypothetical protein
MSSATAAPTSGPIKVALKAKLSANTAISAAAVGGIHEGINVRKTINYPYVTYSLAYAPIVRHWGSVMLIAGVDVVARGFDPDEVSSLDVLITEELDGGELWVPGLTTLIVQREEELPLSPDRNAEGKKVYANGGTYSIWADKNFLNDE